MTRRRRTHKLTSTEEGTCEDTKTELAREGHSLSEGHRERELVGHRKKEKLTRDTHFLERTGEGLVMTWKETDRPRRTHYLEPAEEGTCQDTERDRPTEAYSPTRDGRGRDLSGHRKKPTNRGALTFWRRQREGPVRTRKKTDRPRRTHILILETAEGGICQDTERNRPTETHSLSKAGRGRDSSGHGKKTTE